MANTHFLLISILSSSVGFFVWWKGKTRQANVSFLLVALSASTWLLFLYLLSNTQIYEWVVWFSRLAYAAGMIAPAGLLHFVNVYPNTIISRNRLLLIYVSALIIVSLCLTPLVVTDCEIYTWGVKAETGNGIFAVILYFIISLSFIIGKIIREYRRSNNTQKRQWIFIVLGLPVPILHILITNIILPRIWFEQAYKLGPIAALEMVGILGFAIYRYNLFDIKIIVKKALYYSLLTIMISGIYVFCIFMIPRLLGQTTNVTYIVLISSLLIALTLRPLYSFIDAVTDKLFYRKRHDYVGYFEKLYEGVSYVDNLKVTLEMMIQPVVEIARFRFVAVYLKNTKLAQHYERLVVKGNKAGHLPESILVDHILPAYAAKRKEPIDTEEFRYDCGHLLKTGSPESELLNFLDHTLNVKLTAAIRVHDEVLGFIVLGPKMNEEPMTPYEKRFVKNFAREMTNIIENNMLYSETLRNERLALIGTMSSSFAHEIRNPLSAISSYMELLRERPRDEAFMKQFFEIVPEELTRLERLTGDLLTFAKSDAQQFEMISLNDLIARAITLIHKKTKDNNIIVKFEADGEHYLQADRQQIYQTVLNMLLNAIHAIETDGTIAIRLYYEDEFAVVTITDSGPGIKTEDLSKIFEPFFSTKLYGTGLGLTTCKRIIDAHRGHIQVESEPAQGTCFKVMLPLN